MQKLRGISIVSTVVDVYERILEKRLKEEIKFDERQVLLGKVEICRTIFYLFYVAFLNSHKAFDTIPRRVV